MSDDRLLAPSLLAFVLSASAACQKEAVIPFPDSGDPCSGAGNSLQIDCAEYGDQTCIAPGSTCPRTIYGCAEGGYFKKQDDSQCPAEAGGGSDASLLGDGNVLGADGASDAGDATLGD